MHVEKLHFPAGDSIPNIPALPALAYGGALSGDVKQTVAPMFYTPWRQDTHVRTMSFYVRSPQPAALLRALPAVLAFSEYCVIARAVGVWVPGGIGGAPAGGLGLPPVMIGPISSPPLSMSTVCERSRLGPPCCPPRRSMP